MTGSCFELRQAPLQALTHHIQFRYDAETAVQSTNLRTHMRTRSGLIFYCDGRLEQYMHGILVFSMDGEQLVGVKVD